ncbi:metallophosphoesterase [Opitutaceae bacterium]|nr:metallophosphoesterase [Opitutaceae bacterium]
MKALSLLLAFLLGISLLRSADFGPDWENLDTAVNGRWWEKTHTGRKAWLEMVKVPRDEVVAFAIYTIDRGMVKLTAQMYPLYPDESRKARLELQIDGEWQEVASALIYELGWSAHFRINGWDESKSVPYRVRHGEEAQFEGVLRANDKSKNEIVIGNLSCNSNQDRGDRNSIVANLKKQDPDMLFFAGDQTYDHTEHTAGWLLWGAQFAEIIKDRPVVTIPDDHDIGQGNLWGEGGVQAKIIAGNDGGYFYPADYVRMVERCQTWHLPDPYDATPIAQGIGVYYTSYNVGGIDFAIIEDRKFKTGPNGEIPPMGPRPDHINEPTYKRSAVDVPGLKLLGDRQLAFLDNWSEDWTDAEMKCVLSQTNFAGAVHLHGSFENRLLADLDSNGWPQTGRKNALKEMRKAMAFHLAGDQHLSVLTRHGIENWRDGPVTFVSPAIVNNYYGRWWWPEGGESGPNPVEASPLPWTGDFEDGLGNKISMLAYANPDPEANRRGKRDPKEDWADGYGLARFYKNSQEVVFECWPRFADVGKGDSQQYPGWPMRFKMSENDGREPVAYLPELNFKGIENPVVQIIEESTGEALYTTRVRGRSYRPKVFTKGKYTIRVGEDLPILKSVKGVRSVAANSKKKLSISIR